MPRRFSKRRGCERDRRQAGLCDLFVVLWHVETRPDGTDHFAAGDNREAALHLDKARRGNGGDAAVVDRFLERLARLLDKAAVRALPGASSTLAR